MIKLLIFDLDGTLIDSAPDIIATVNGLLEERGEPLIAPEIIKAAIGEGLRALIYKLFPRSMQDAEYLLKLEMDFVRLYEKHLLRATQVYPGVTDFLAHCDRKIALVTNKQAKFTHRTLAGLGLDRFPWVRVYGADSLSERKPSPLPLHEAMSAASVTPVETLMIGDGIPDMVAANRASVRAIACEYGYTEPLKLRELGPYATIRQFTDLATILTQLER